MKKFLSVLFLMALPVLILSCDSGGSGGSLTAAELQGLEDELVAAANSIDYTSSSVIDGVYICNGGGFITYTGTSVVGPTTTYATATLGTGNTTVVSITNCTTAQGITLAGDITFSASGDTGGVITISMTGPGVTANRLNESGTADLIKTCYIGFTYTEGHSQTVTGNVCGDAATE
jgi:hypothetical protein